MSEKTLTLYPPRQIDAQDNVPRFKAACDAIVAALVDARGNQVHVAKLALVQAGPGSPEAAALVAARKFRRWIAVARAFERDLPAEALAEMKKRKITPWTPTEAREAGKASSTPEAAPGKGKAARAATTDGKPRKRVKRAA